MAVALSGSHVSPDDAVSLPHGIRLGTHFGLEVRFHRLRGHVDTGTVHIELPAVVDAAQAILFVSSKEHRGTAVRAGVRDNANAARGGSKGDEVLIQKSQPYGCAVGDRQFFWHQRWYPVLAHQLAHGRFRPNTAHQFVL